MTYKPQFDVDLRHGEMREDALAHLLMRAKVEVKSDRKCRTTGNVAIEYEQVCRDGVTRPSGISITEADWYAIEFDDDRWVAVLTREMKQLARRAINEKRHGWVGDANEHHNAFVPLKWMFEPVQVLREAA